MKSPKFKIGKLIFIKESGKNKHGATIAKYLCFCGNEFITTKTSIKSEQTKSCGCYKKYLIEVLPINNFKHGKADTKIANIFSGMLKRCNNVNHKQYKDYGGRGIKICKKWNTYEKFIKWAFTNGYKEGLTIDRKNNNRGYSPGNCRWVNRAIQAINQRICKTNTSGFQGVRFDKNAKIKKWRSDIRINKIKQYLGQFKTPQEASAAYQKAKKKRDKMYLEEFKNSQK